MNQVVYDKNIAALNKRPAVKAILPKLSGVDATHVYVDEGCVLVEYSGRTYQLSSRYDTAGCAKVFVDNILGDVKSESIIFVVGFGDGTYIKAILDKAKDNIICVYEPEPAVFLKVIEDIDVADILANPRLNIILADYMDEYIPVFMREYIKTYNVKINKLFALPNYNVLYANKCGEFVKKYIDASNTLEINKTTMELFEQKQIENTLVTIPDFVNQYSIRQLKKALSDKISDMPAIIVSAGPSLDKNIDELKRAKNKAFLIVVDTALRSAKRHDIIPDITITVDPAKRVELFSDAGFTNVPLVVHQYSNSDVIGMHSGMRFYYANNGAYIEYLSQKYGIGMDMLSTGGSVATDAFSLARYLGFKTIVLIGQDLAYPNNKKHASAAFDDKEEEALVDDYHFYIDDIYGNPILTDYTMNEYIKWFEEEIPKDKSVNVIDATEGGALIKGTKIDTLKNVIDTYCKNECDFAGIIASIDKNFNDDVREKVVKELKEIPSVLECYKKQLEEGISAYNKIVSLAGKQKIGSGEFNRLVKQTGDLNEFIESVAVFELIASYTQRAEYAAQEEINDYDQTSSQYTQIKLAVTQGIRMYESYIDGIDRFLEDFKVIQESL